MERPTLRTLFQDVVIVTLFSTKTGKNEKTEGQDLLLEEFTYKKFNKKNKDEDNFVE